VRGLQAATSVLVLLASAAALLGIARNRRLRDGWAFAAYLAAVLLLEGAVVLWPGRFFHWWFFLLKQAVYDVLKVGVAVELAHQAFRVYPAARATARRVLFGVLLGSTGLIALAAARADHWTGWQPPIVSGTIWLFTATAALVLWYRLPLHAWHRAILAGFTPYLLVFVTLLRVLETHEAKSAYAALGFLDSLAFLVVTVWWAVSAWRPYPERSVAPEVARRLRLEAV
jgi:hypothetical protein